MLFTQSYHLESVWWSAVSKEGVGYNDTADVERDLFGAPRLMVICDHRRMFLSLVYFF
jgi:hypothetical protein